MSTEQERSQDAQTTLDRTQSIGGFSAETEVFTTRGPRRIADLRPGDRIYALNSASRLAKPKLVTDVRSVSEGSELVAINGKRVDLHLHPSHPVLHTTRSIRHPRCVSAGALPDQEYHRFVNEWKTATRPRLKTVDITDLVTEFEARAVTSDHGHTFRAALPDGCEPSYNNSHSGYHFDPTTFKRYQTAIEAAADEVSVRQGRKQRTTPYLFDGDDFIEFIGWFVTEGSVYWRKNKRTAQVQIAQETPSHRRRIASLLDRMGLEVSTNPRRFVFSSTLLGGLLEALCGSSSQTKHLPSFVWRLPTDQQRLLLQTLMDGDGNDCGVYYTASEQLANDVLRLGVELGVKPRYGKHNDTWRLFFSAGNDGFRASKNVSTLTRETTLYQLSVEDFGAVLAGRNGRFQWVGVNRVT